MIFNNEHDKSWNDFPYGVGGPVQCQTGMPTGAHTPESRFYLNEKYWHTEACVNMWTIFVCIILDHSVWTSNEFSLHCVHHAILMSWINECEQNPGLILVQENSPIILLIVAKWCWMVLYNFAIIGSGNGLPPWTGGKPLPEPMMTYCQQTYQEKPQWSLNQITKMFIQENSFENVFC